MQLEAATTTEVVGGGDGDDDGNACVVDTAHGILLYQIIISTEPRNLVFISVFAILGMVLYCWHRRQTLEKKVSVP
jgi:hypothetical protein